MSFVNKKIAVFLFTLLGFSSQLFAQANICTSSDAENLAALSDVKCSLDQLRSECKAFAVEDASIKKYLKCGPREQEPSLTDVGLTCASQFFEPLKESVVAAANAVTTSIKTSLKNRSEFVKLCEADPKVRSAVVGSLPQYSKYKPNILGKVSCEELALEFENQQRTLKSDKAVANIEAKRFQEVQKIYKSLTESKDNAFTAILKRNSDKMSCLNSEGKWMMRCYALFSVVDPLMAAGLVGKAPALFRAAGITPKIIDGGTTAIKSVSAEGKIVGTEKAAAEITSTVELAKASRPVTNIRESFESIMRKPKDPAQATEIEHLDNVFYADIESSFSKLPDVQKKRLVQVVKDAKVGQNFSKEEINGMPYLDGASAQITYNKTNLPEFQYRLALEEHPYMRVASRHEFSHLTRLDVGKVTAKEANEYANQIISGKKLGLYKEEAKAWSDQYNFLNKAYTKEDLPRLKEIYGQESPTMKLLLESKAASKNEKGQIAIDFENLPKDMDAKEAYSAFLEHSANEQFLMDVEKAVSQPRSSYVRSNLDSPAYRKQQKDGDTKLIVAKYFRAAQWVGTAGAAALAYKEFEESLKTQPKK